MAGLGALIGVANLFSVSHVMLPSQKAFLFGLGIMVTAINGVTAYGLWLLRNWARLIVIILTALSVVGLAAGILVPMIVSKSFRFAPAPIASGIVCAMAFEGLIIWYLCKNSTKTFFMDRHR